MSRALRFAPLALLAIVLGALLWRLASPGDTNVHSRLEGKPLPAFALGTALAGKPALASIDLATGEPHLVNVFASWCVPCAGEVGILQHLQRDGVKIEGIAIRDKPDDLAAFLSRNGDPYERIGNDPQSSVQIALGSAGVPETFVVDGKGIIRKQHIGAIDEKDIPVVLAELRQAS